MSDLLQLFQLYPTFSFPLLVQALLVQAEISSKHAPCDQNNVLKAA
ncbi:hypothetical protein [Superficieibacter sp. HKU1]|nr:hypothetical protein [Superficieibacter sp. HKU1]WES70187.1 hypothetical protein P0H77_09510 [Superficieibacter sp. HKU1]